MQSSTQSIHVVRRYGKVGGMERYVWELTHSLARAGHQVKILCHEQSHRIELDISERNRIQVHTVGDIGLRKPRWIFQLRFQRQVNKFVDSTDASKWVVHSHERCSNHDVTTFHSASIRSRPITLMDFLSPRLRTWRRLEALELNASTVQKIFPVSHLLGETLSKHYPECRSRLQSPAYPGVGPEFSPLDRANNERTIGFLGVEWERKGLDYLVQAVSLLRARDPSVKLLVAGCEIASVQHLFREWTDGYQLLGWVDALQFYPRISLLALPARNEPFGMVAAEANACGLPIVVSPQCGITPLVTEDRGSVVDPADTKKLADACWAELNRAKQPDSMGLDWNRLATQYVVAYKEIIGRKNSL